MSWVIVGWFKRGYLMSTTTFSSKLRRTMTAGFVASLLAVGAVAATATPAQAAMVNCDVSVYSPLDTGGGVWFKSGVWCPAAHPDATRAQAGPERSTGVIAYYATASTSSGTTSLSSQRTVSTCATSGNYRTVGWGQDKFTNVEEKRSGYVYISC